jgi:hypothetical protein
LAGGCHSRRVQAEIQLWGLLLTLMRMDFHQTPTPIYGITDMLNENRSDPNIELRLPACLLTEVLHSLLDTRLCLQKILHFHYRLKLHSRIHSQKPGFSYGWNLRSVIHVNE